MVSVHPPLGEKHTERITGHGAGAGGWTGAVAQPARRTITIRDRRFIEEDYITFEYP
jgi:hypothetical protein